MQMCMHFSKADNSVLDDPINLNDICTNQQESYNLFLFLASSLPFFLTYLSIY